MATMNRVVLGASSEVLSGTIDWTIPNFTRFSTYPSQTTSFDSGELHLPDLHVWNLGLDYSPLPVGQVGETKVTFRLSVWKKFMYTHPYGQYTLDTVHTGRVAVRCKLSILDDTGKEIYHQGSDDFRSEKTFSTRIIDINSGRGSVTEDIPAQRILHPCAYELPLLHNDTLNVRMHFEYVSNVSLPYQKSELVALPSLESDLAMASDYMKLYTSKEGADFILVSQDGKEFAVHRTVLRARSVYFSGMLNSAGKEAQSGRCVLPDLDAKTLEIFLHHMYGGLRDVPQELIQSVLVASDKYQFQQLKDHCEIMLTGQVMIGTAAHFLILADKYTAPKLREACLKLIKDSFKIFEETGGMKKLQADGSANLVNEVKDMVYPKPPS